MYVCLCCIGDILFINNIDHLFEFYIKQIKSKFCYRFVLCLLRFLRKSLQLFPLVNNCEQKGFFQCHLSVWFIIMCRWNDIIYNLLVISIQFHHFITSCVLIELKRVGQIDFIMSICNLVASFFNATHTHTCTQWINDITEI